MSKALVMATAMAALVPIGCSGSSTPPPKTTATVSTERAAPMQQTAPPTSSEQAMSPEQATINDSAAALERMESNPDFASLTTNLRQARGVMIFPHVQKGALLVGGAGGNGVLLSRNDQGQWSAPAFYGLAGGSAGLQIGWETASIVLVFMNDTALRSAISQGLTLGANASVAGGTLGSSAGAAGNVQTGKDLYSYVDVGGVFAGASLDGLVVSGQQDRDQAYYGSANATTSSVVLERLFDRPGTQVLKQALSRVG